MTFPHRLKFVLFLICYMQHAQACLSTCSCFCMAANSSMITRANPSTTAVPTMSTMVADNKTASKDETYTTGTPMSATTKASATATVLPTSTTRVTTKSSSMITKANASTTAVPTLSTMAAVNITASEDGTTTTGTPMSATTGASATATVIPTSTTHVTTKSSSADGNITSAPVTTPSSMQHAHACASTCSCFCMTANSSMIKRANPSTTAVPTMSTIVADNKTASKDETYTTGTPMSATTEASATATVLPTSTTRVTTKSSSADGNITSAPVTVSPSMSTIRNASFSIGTGYSSPDCASCSIGGTITVTLSCSIKMPPNDDKKCDKDEFNKTSCGYVTLANKVYRCAEVEKNFTYHEKEHLKPVKQCDDVCPASGSVLSAHLVFIFSSGLAVGLLSQTL